MRKFTHKSGELVLERWGEVEWLLIPSMLTAVCGWLGVSLCLPTTWWVFLGHIRQQHRISTTLSLMASTKMNRAVSRKCYYQGFFFFNVKTGLPSTCMTGSQSIYTLSYCWTGEETTHLQRDTISCESWKQGINPAVSPNLSFKSGILAAFQ